MTQLSPRPFFSPIRQPWPKTAADQHYSNLQLAAFVFNLSAIISLYFGIDSFVSWLFLLSIILMVAAMIRLTIEIQIANSALDVHFSDMEKHKERQDY